MKQNLMVQGLANENRRLREHIEKMASEHNQGKWMEDLVAAAMTGLLSRQGEHELKPEQAAKLAIEAGEAVLARIVASIRHAEVQKEQAGEPEEQPAEQESNLILQP